jgi:hypothetical protein
VRALYRKVQLNGPFLEVKATQWIVISKDDSDDELETLNEQTAGIIQKCYDTAT